MLRSSFKSGEALPENICDSKIFLASLTCSHATFILPILSTYLNGPKSLTIIVIFLKFLNIFTKMFSALYWWLHWILSHWFYFYIINTDESIAAQLFLEYTNYTFINIKKDNVGNFVLSSYHCALVIEQIIYIKNILPCTNITLFYC